MEKINRNASENEYPIKKCISDKVITVQRDSPRCMLRIPDATNFLQIPSLSLPSVVKSKSPSPLPISPRIAKDKGYEFPEISKASPSKFTPEPNTRKLKKHSSDKRIRINLLEFPEIMKNFINDEEANK